MSQHVVQFFHISDAHVLGEPGGGGLILDKIFGCLHGVAGRQLTPHEEFGRVLQHPDQLPAGDLPKDLAGPAGPAQVTLDHSTDGLTDLGERLPALKVNDSIDIQTLVGLAPSQNRKMNHRVPAFPKSERRRASKKHLSSRHPPRLWRRTPGRGAVR